VFEEWFEVLDSFTRTLYRNCHSYKSKKKLIQQLIVRNSHFLFLIHVIIKTSTIFWDITPCSPLNVNRRFGGTYRLHLQGRRISKATNQRECRWQASKQAWHLSSVDIQRTTRRYIQEDSTLQACLLAICFHAGFLIRLTLRP
jgi:hypothetical protein